MPAVQCPIAGCDYVTPNLDASIVAALITAHATAHAPAAPQHAAATKVEKVRRPTIAIGGSTEDWQYFTTRWKEYVSATKLTGADVVIQLLECCDEPLRKDLTRSAGGSLTNKTADEVLASIRQLAVTQEKTMVARATLHGMRQDRDEPVRAFVARLRGQAGICKFQLKCPSPDCETVVSYTDQIICDVLTRGIADQDIQLDLLGEQDQDMSLETVISYIEAKEAGKRSAGKLHDSPQLASAISQYRHQQKTQVRDKFRDNEPCHYCGLRGHGARAPIKDRQRMCKAFGHKCEKCNKDNHFGSVCRSAAKPKHSPTTDEASTLFLCAHTQAHTHTQTPRMVGINHHVFDKSTKTWVERRSRDQPLIDVKVAVTNGLGFSCPRGTNTHTQTALADTGCQSCLSGTDLLSHIGLTQNDLLPVQTKIKTADNGDISLLGAIPLTLTAAGRSTTQLTYVTDAIHDKLFLSREACTKLGIIDPKFPHTTVNDLHDASTPDNHDKSCNCPRRQKPPTPPTLPYPPTDENREKLERFLLDYYRSSTFNTCDKQPLPMMEGPPATTHG